MPFSFAFANGIYAPGILGTSGPNAIIGAGLTLFFLQTFNRWRSWRGAVVTVLAVASTALLTETGVILTLAGWGGITVLYLIQHRTWKLPARLWHWWAVIGLGTGLGFLQGGALMDIVTGWAREFLGQQVASYQTVGFVVSFNPALVSTHLGVLQLTNLAQLVVAMLEIGPIFLALPLLAVWGLKAYRAERWYEAVLIFSTFLSLATVFVQFSGSTGVRNTTRLYDFVGLCALYAVPLGWVWASHRSETLKLTAALVFAVIALGGVVIFGSVLSASHRPTYSYFLTDLDARIYDQYWDQLEPGSLVFDPEPERGTTLFARFTNAAYTWYDFKPEWKALRNAPTPATLRAAGYRYLYLDQRYWRDLSPQSQESLRAPCVKLLVETEDSNGFRRLFDLKACP